ncbi:MAG: hypothetical protein J0H66_01795 [Solirubrobacterales bacterium]|nr:hypothetical protein [Solirubrobacterales bacterium]OJU95409.1 MAG: hypothetical protein BGO23_06080 [Solirubrobacterales bacterium 67-14]
MSAKTFPTIGRRTQVAAALAGLVALLAGLAIMNGPGNEAGAAEGGASAAGQAVYLGKASAKRIPLCPQRCSGLAIVSGFQAKAGGTANAYQVPFVGKITRWRIKLGEPNASDMKFFQNRFGMQPQAAIGVLARRSQNGKVVYKLRRRSQVQNLTNFLGKTATFTVPGIKVNKGDYVALLVPTWAPALSTPRACQVINTAGDVVNPAVCDQFNQNNSWVASRNRKTCNAKKINAKNSQPQMKINSLASYGCRFNGALTYGVRVESR